jgi:ACR3 family arsenite efflux pump ArsB
MMYPILCKVKYETLHHVFRERKIWVQIGFSIVVNWIVAPLVMVCLSLVLYRPLILPILMHFSLASHGRSFLISQVSETV